jgi:hypothetical protein
MSYPEELGGIGPVAKYSHPGPTGACEEGDYRLTTITVDVPNYVPAFRPLLC